MNQASPIVRCPSCGRQNRVRPAARGAPHCAACGAALAWVTESGEADFATVVEQSDLPVLVDFWAPWCAPCRVVSPIVERIGEDLRGQLKVVKVNSDTAPTLASRFNIRAIPTLILFDHGNVRDRVTGALGASALRAWVRERLPAAEPKQAPRAAGDGPA